jgi:hypothetical protein
MKTQPISLCAALGLFVSLAAAQQTAAPPSKNTETQMAAAPAKLKAASLNLVPYPAKKQSSAQQAKDDTECYDWTKQSTGIDLAAPVTVADNASAEQQPKKHERLRGAARGAAVGAVAGEVLDDKGGEGAALGAAAGAAQSGRKQRTEAAQREKDTAAATRAAEDQRLETFRKGYSACMEARGYTLK